MTSRMQDDDDEITGPIDMPIRTKRPQSRPDYDDLPPPPMFGNMAEQVAWMSGVVFRLDAEREIRHATYIEDRQKVQACLDGIKEINDRLGHEPDMSKGRAAKGMAGQLYQVRRDVRAIKEDIGEDPSDSTQEQGTGLKGSIATLMADRKFVRWVVGITGALITCAEAARLIYSFWS